MKEFKCKDCIHYYICKDTVTEDNWTDDTPIEIREIFSPKYCENFFLATNVAPVVHATWETILETDNFIIDYDKTNAKYRVSYFEDNHFVDDVVFDAYETIVHGEWVKTPYSEVRRCSCCERPSNISKRIPNYCPNCGAKMDGGNSNG